MRNYKRKKIEAVRIIAVLVAMLFSIGSIYSQNNSMRLELPVNGSNKPYQLCNFGEKGILIFYKKHSDDKNKELWAFWHYDKYFIMQWETEVSTPANFYFQQVSIEGDKAFFAFYNDEKKYEKDNLFLVSINITAKKLVSHTLKVPKKGKVSSLITYDGKAFIALSGKKDKISLFSYDIKNQQQKELNTDKEHIDVMNLTIDKQKKELIVLERKILSRRNYETKLLHFSLTGNIISEHKINMLDNKKIINNSEYTSLGNEGYIVTGTYIDANTSRPQKTDDSQVSSGLFFAKYNNHNIEENIKFYDFSDFKDFYNYVYRENITSLRKINKDGKKELAVNFQLLTHNIIKQDSIFILTLEAYYPEYHTERRYVYDYYGRMIPTYYNIFDGYRYTNAMIACFDDAGELLWNNGIKIQNTLSYDLYPRVNIDEENTSLVLSYANEGNIVAKVINKDKIISNQEKYPVELRFNRDILINEEDACIIKWYGEYYIYKSYQTIRNNTRKKNKRTVFAITKLIYE